MRDYSATKLGGTTGCVGPPEHRLAAGFLVISLAFEPMLPICATEWTPSIYLSARLFVFKHRGSIGHVKGKIFESAASDII